LFSLHAISPENETVDTFTEKALRIYDIVDYIHLRNQAWKARDFLTVIDRIKQHDQHVAKLIINDRLDIAHVSGISRVHLPSHGIEPQDVRNHFKHTIYGCSVHNVEMAMQCEEQQANYLIFGHVFSTKSKEGLPARGLTQLKKVTQSVSVPVIAIGGITPNNIEDVMHAGAQGVAIMSGIFDVDNCRKKALRYRNAINQYFRGGV